MGSSKKNKTATYKKPGAVRSKIMRSVKTKNTGAELIVRRTLRSIGLYYRLHVKDLPGTPDIVFRKSKKIIFVNGCFWHAHKCSRGGLPKSNAKFWKDKMEKNVERDRRKEKDLKAMGWKVLILWQCEIQNPEKLRKMLCKFLKNELNSR